MSDNNEFKQAHEEWVKLLTNVPAVIAILNEFI